MGSPEKKVVLKLDLHDDKGKQKAMKAASALIGIDSITMDMKDRKMTVVGVVDPVAVVSKLRKSWRTDIISIGPAKEPKKEEPKKEEEKKEEPKKEEEKKEEKKEEPKKEAEKKEEPKKEEPKEAEKKKEVAPAELVMYRAPHNPYPYVSMRYAVHSVEEDPNSCAIL